LVPKKMSLLRSGYKANRKVFAASVRVGRVPVYTAEFPCAVENFEALFVCLEHIEGTCK